MKQMHSENITFHFQGADKHQKNTESMFLHIYILLIIRVTRQDYYYKTILGLKQTM